MNTVVIWKDFWHNRPVNQKVGAVVAVALAVFHIYTSLFGCFDALIQRSIHLGCGLILTFLVFPSGRKKGQAGFIDMLMIVSVIVVIAYLLVRYDYITTERYTLISPLSWYEVILGVATVVLVLEASRRVVGTGLFFISLAFLLYPLVAPYFPGVLYSTPIQWTAILDFNYLSMGGVFGIPIGVSATDIAVFIIFGAVLVNSGGALLISNIAAVISGRAVGGPAKVAVVASALMGTVSGSATANVATIGSVTIPMMKKAGYRPEFAGAVEAMSSTGGQIMPPVMGAAAFVMAAFTGIPYSQIIIYAIFPAILYYLSLFITVDLEARRFKLPSLPSDITLKETLRDYGHMIIPILVMVYLLVAGYTPRLAGGLGTVTALVICQLKPETRLNFQAILSALESGSKGMLIVITSCGAAGIIVGAVDLTGLGQRLGAAFVDMAGGHLLLGLILAMFLAMLLGTGMPTTPAYLVQVATVIPALVKMGLPIPVAHMFAFYYSCLSLITPPVAAASYTAAAIADSDAWKTGWLAFRMAAVSYIVPFMFVFDQSLLLIGSFRDVLISVVTACVGVFFLAVAIEGYFKKILGWIQRMVFAVGGILLIVPNWKFSLVGALLLALMFIFQFNVGKKSQVGKED